MTREEAGKKLSDWAKYMEDPSAVPELDQPCTDDEIIEAMSVAGKALSGTSTANDGLDEAAERWAEKHPFNGRVSSFKAGAEWKEAKMLEGAVEGFIYQTADYYPKELIARYEGELQMGDKVKIIIVKEDEQYEKDNVQ